MATHRIPFAIAVLFLVVCGLLLADFVRRGNAIERFNALPSTAIVFTGQFDRIERGLDLLSEGHVDRLFISGVNAKAGLGVERFADQFSLTAQQMSWLESGVIILSEDANTTLENAIETACWLETQPETDAVVLISSKPHLPRASLALSATIGPVDIVRVASDLEYGRQGAGYPLSEFRRFVATWAIVMLPHSFWPIELPGMCREA